MGETNIESRVRELERSDKKQNRDIQTARDIAENANQAVGVVRQANNGRQLTYIKCPSGGIPARSTTTLGSATCDIYIRSGSTISASGETATVYNVSSAIAGSGGKYGIAAWVDDAWSIIVESCA